MFEIIRIYTENGQEKKESIGVGDDTTIKNLTAIAANYATKYTGSRFEKREDSSSAEVAHSEEWQKKLKKSK